MAFLDLDDDQRYRALKSRDRRFDGVFIVGVRTTGIYCRPSCPTPVHPLRKNVDFFTTTAAAQRAGLRACKRCRPDATPGSPEWNLRDDLVGRAMRLINQGYLDTRGVADLAGELAVTERHLRRIMIDAVGAPPLAIARAQRAQTARILIETTTMAFTDVAFAAGFSSLRQFNDTVRAVFSTTPTDLRRARATTNRRSSQAVRSPAGLPDAGVLSIRLPFRTPLAADHLLGWLAYRAVEGITTVDDDVVHTALRLHGGEGVASLRFDDGWVQCDLELDEIGDLALAVAQCRTMLDLDADPTHIDATLGAIPQVEPLVSALPGLRSPGSADGFATLIFAILGQQRSVAAARTLAGRIARRAATGHDEPEAEGDEAAPRRALRPFPTPAAIADLDFDGIGLTRRTVATIAEVAKRFDGRTDELGPGADRESLRRELLSIGGIGPWTSNYLAMRALGHPDIFLAGDLVAERAASALALTPELIDAARPWRSYLTHHLWAASAALAKPEPEPKVQP